MGMVGWYGTRDDAEARATLDRALELGITHLDTAAVYQDGENERFVGECIRGRRAGVFLATKCGLGRSPQGTLQIDNRPQTIRESCDASLARLGTDRIDLYYLHRIDRKVPIEESMGAMAELVKAGKVRHVGLSEAAAATLRRAHRVHPVAAVQSELSLWTQSAPAAVLEVCRDLGIGFVAYSPLGRGFLTGAISRPEDLAEGDTRRIFPRFTPENLEGNLEMARRVSALAARFRCTSAQLALAWVLHRDPLVLPIPGTKKRRYLEENAGAAEMQLSETQLSHIARECPESLVQGERYPESMMGVLNA
jgi:aryl-alcohol dehydrogenase-like predicted oxidoreductase